MKKMNQFIAWGLMVCAVCFTACSDDDNGDSWDGDSVVVNAAAYESWTYFDFETGMSKTLNVKSQEGGVAGMYEGDLEIPKVGTTENVNVIISTVSKDTVLISMDTIELAMSGSSASKFVFSAKAKVEEGSAQWVLTGAPTEIESGGVILENVSFSGTIGKEEGTQAVLTVSFQPKGMPFALSGTYTATVGDNKTYVLDGDEISFDWDIAFHKYDIKTNGGAAVKLNTTDLVSVTAASITGMDFTVDTDDHQVMVDMSKMQQGFVGYQSTKLNEVLCGWVTATPTGSMPPYTYELNRNVFVVKTADGEYAKIRFTDYSNDDDKTVYAAFDYEFPLK